MCNSRRIFAIISRKLFAKYFVSISLQAKGLINWKPDVVLGARMFAIRSSLIGLTIYCNRPILSTTRLLHFKVEFTMGSY